MIFDPVAFLLLLFSALLFPHCCGCLPGIVVVVEFGCCDSGWMLGFFVGQLEIVGWFVSIWGLLELGVEGWLLFVWFRVGLGSGWVGFGV